MLEELKREVFDCLINLPKNGLVQGTSGNVSGRKENNVVIKPSGVKYEKLSPLDLVVVTLEEGTVVEGNLKPSVATEAHLHIYRRQNDVQGIVHTHSTFATVFATLGKAIPLYTTEQADSFGTQIPVSKFIPPGDEEIGKEFSKKATGDKFRALLIKNHGVFTAGKSPTEALKASVTIEHSAKISFFTELLGNPKELPPEVGKRLHDQYLSEYGQSNNRKETQ